MAPICLPVRWPHPLPGGRRLGVGLLLSSGSSEGAACCQLEGGCGPACRQGSCLLRYFGRPATANTVTLATPEELGQASGPGWRLPSSRATSSSVQPVCAPSACWVGSSISLLPCGRDVSGGIFVLKSIPALPQTLGGVPPWELRPPAGRPWKQGACEVGRGPSPFQD